VPTSVLGPYTITSFNPSIIPKVSMTIPILQIRNWRVRKEQLTVAEAGSGYLATGHIDYGTKLSRFNSQLSHFVSG
jgi:hypothetical protein